jgi:hypothetical protein
MSVRDGEKAREVGQQQLLFRDVNERIKEIAESFDRGAEIEILCECGLSGCTERFKLPVVEYERLRLFPTRFAISPGHEIPSGERIVEENERYIVVEKFGDGAVAAIKLDPRRHS